MFTDMIVHRYLGETVKYWIGLNKLERSKLLKLVC